MADEKKFTLHYGGKEFAVPRGDLLDEVDLESPGTLKVNLGDGGWRTALPLFLGGPERFNRIALRGLLRVADGAHVRRLRRAD